MVVHAACRQSSAVNLRAGFVLEEELGDRAISSSVYRAPHERAA